MAVQLTWANAKTAYTNAGQGIDGARALHVTRSARQRRYYAQLYLDNYLHVPPDEAIVRARNARLLAIVASYDVETT